MKLNIIDFEKFFKLKKNEILNLSPQFDSLNYDVVKGEKKNRLINDIIKIIFITKKFRVVNKNSVNVWNKGWREIYEKIKNKKFTEDLLKPQYFSLHPIMRYNDMYIQSSKYFSYQMDQLIRKLVLYKFIKKTKKIIELGSGTGNNQLLINKIFPNIEQVASDWSDSSISINKLLAKKINKKIITVKFNMVDLRGWNKFDITKDTLLLTTHSLEQISDNSYGLLKKILNSKIRRIINIEPIIENYNQDNLLDFLAISFHKKKNYLVNWLTNLRKLEQEKKIRFIFNKRFKFGDKFHEAYSIIVWEKI